MKFIFFNSCDKKKNQTIKAKTQEEFMTVAKIVKCELTKNSILKDLDFKGNRLMCKIDDKVLSMKELWELLDKKLKITDKVSKDKKKKKKDKKKKDKKKKISYDSKKEKPINITKNSEGLVRISHRY